MLQRNCLNTFYNYYIRCSIYASYCRILRPHHCICCPYHYLANSGTFWDLALRFPGLSRSWKFYKHNSRTFRDLALRFPGPNSFSRTFQDLALKISGTFQDKLIFQDFPVPGILQTIPELSRRCGNPVSAEFFPWQSSLIVVVVSHFTCSRSCFLRERTARKWLTCARSSWPCSNVSMTVMSPMSDCRAWTIA